MLYLDTSILVAILSKEVGSEHLDAWLGNQTKGYIAISDWVIAEFSSALSSKVRTSKLARSSAQISLWCFAGFVTIIFKSGAWSDSISLSPPDLPTNSHLVCGPRTLSIWRSVRSKTECYVRWISR